MGLLYLVLAIIFIIFIWAVVVFNSLVAKRNRVKNAWSDIDVQLKRRYDLVPNLVETVRGYKDYEASVLEKVTQARTSVLQAQKESVASRAEAENMLSSALKTLFAVSENYPQLRASENFQKLQQELANLENDIQSARRYYNAAVREFNIAVQVFPANLIAGLLGFQQAEFFGAAEAEREPVKVSF
jgi:LemA protein